MPEVVQLMWLHVEEPEINKDVVHQDRVWYKIRARDVSGAIQVGMPQRNALSLASCNTVENSWKNTQVVNSTCRFSAMRAFHGASVCRAWKGRLR